MHYLHRILVYLPDVISEEKMKEKELLETIRLYADAETECFYQRAFDWRETDSAGCWSDMYPQQDLSGIIDGGLVYERTSAGDVIPAQRDRQLYGAIKIVSRQQFGGYR